MKNLSLIGLSIVLFGCPVPVTPAGGGGGGGSDEFVCGNGEIEGTEVCDDGNEDATDGCTNECQEAACGDGVLRVDLTDPEAIGYEACDDGNAEDNDGCLSNCIEASCGDGFVRIDLSEGDEGFEACDDGNEIDTDECLAGCVLAACGDGLVHEGVEDCDDGNDVEDDACLPTCAAASCGDGIKRLDLTADDEGFESCDDGNEADDDACTNACLEAACGDGIMRVDLAEGDDGFEACDDGNLLDTDDCVANCVLAACGDGFVFAGEEDCDDANDSQTDECLNDCIAASCGDTHVQEGVEDCDDGNDENGDACLNECLDASCGDGIQRLDLDENEQAFEACDDGNEADNDACTNGCSNAICGDGIARVDLAEGQDDFEACDDGNEFNTDACLVGCVAATCGDGNTYEGEEDCDDQNDVNTDACINCVAAACGDGIQRLDRDGDGNLLEACDDGDANADDQADACRLNCALPACGDGVIDDAEACDDGEANADDQADACRVNCALPTCGDGVIDQAEECDDGDGNGVDADCGEDCMTNGGGGGGPIADIDPDLMLYYNFEDEGDEVIDHGQGNATNGTLTGTVALTDDSRYGSSALHSPAESTKDDRLAITGDLTDLDMNEGYSFMAWIKAEPNTGAQGLVVLGACCTADPDEDNARQGFVLNMQSNGRIRFWGGSDANNINYNTNQQEGDLRDGQWHHVGVRANGGTLELRIDGETVETGDTNVPTSPSQTRTDPNNNTPNAPHIGGAGTDGVRGGDVVIDEVRVYRRYLSDEDWTSAMGELVIEEPVAFELPVGIQQGVDVADLEAQGWETCYQATYGAGGNELVNARASEACQGQYMMLGCRETGAATLTVAAAGTYEDVTREVPAGGDNHHVANEVAWYYSPPNSSWGFFRPGDGASRSSADTSRVNGEFRLSWHTRNDEVGGYRCGTTMDLNNSDAWEKMIFVHSGAAAPWEPLERYEAAQTFQDALNSTSMTMAWDGEHFGSASGGSSGGERLARYDADGEVL
ncbi:MAG: hypothetical protein CMH58_05310, partial [Myxococcales bacterium]|nr:hypothetical protein [Myxococcales bacterium]